MIAALTALLDLNLERMLFGAPVFFMIGYGAGSGCVPRLLAPVVFAALLYLLLSSGFYWHVFPRGEGLWTANRVSAGAIFTAVVFAGALSERRERARLRAREASVGNA